jgi:hypothetical protein
MSASVFRTDSKLSISKRIWSTGGPAGVSFVDLFGSVSTHDSFLLFFFYHFCRFMDSPVGFGPMVRPQTRLDL